MGKYMQEIITGALEVRIRECMDRWDELSAKEQWDVIIRLLPYVTPKLSAVAVKTEKRAVVEELLSKVSQQAIDARVVDS